MREKVALWRKEGENVALVPTMGALHDGHLSLVQQAKSIATRVVVSIFVNPTQFAEGEDFDDYPRTWDDDVKALNDLGVDAIYAPKPSHMYPAGFATEIHVSGPALTLEGVDRPHFFKGVATVVTKLLMGVQPDYATFGEKDYQQLMVVKRMVEDLQIPTEIIGCETVREKDGLAMSSRNAYLTDKERKIAPRLHETLQSCAEKIRLGENAEFVLLEAMQTLENEGFKVDYLVLRNAETLEDVFDVEKESLRLLVAARLGKPRLIDNIGV